MTTNQERSSSNLNSHYGQDEKAPSQADKLGAGQQHQHYPLESHATMEQAIRQQQYAVAAAAAAAAAWSSSVFMSNLYQRNMFERFVMPTATLLASGAGEQTNPVRLTVANSTNVSCNHRRSQTGESNLDSPNTLGVEPSKSSSPPFPGRPTKRRRQRRGKRKRRCRKRRSVDSGYVAEIIEQQTTVVASVAAATTTAELVASDGSSGADTDANRDGHDQVDQPQQESEQSSAPCQEAATKTDLCSSISVN